MCGIAGVLDRRGGSVELNVLQSMAAAMAHRGPDDEGFQLSGPVGLAFRRLSIIDVSGGHQPMSDDAGDIWVVLNGEVYNFGELRAQLLGLGYRFRTRSDTECIIHGYAQWGDDVLHHLNGMFGVAIWDARRQRLLLARDRAGIKPLYYQLTASRLVFGSELRAIRAAGLNPVLDVVSLNLFLRYRYTPSPRTPFEGVSKLAPGTRLIAEADGSTRVERWWDYDPAPEAIDVKKAEAELLERYSEAIRRQLVSDVPLGLLLSGGVDSALLLALMARHKTSWPTFTVGFGPAYPDDELEDAAKTARLFGAEHHEIRLDRTTFEEDLAAVVDSLEEPIASPSVVALSRVCSRAREDVKVALIGQGPDELFGGYTRHLGVRYGHMWRALPRPVRRAGSFGLAQLPRSEAVRRGLHSLDEAERLARFQKVFSLLPADEIDNLFHPDLLPASAGDRVLSCWDGVEEALARGDELSAFQYLEVRSALPDELLMGADKLSMRHGLELRVPYLDHDVIEFAGRLPASLKVRHGSRKWLHRRLCRQYLPPEVVRRKKRGFAVDVVDGWYRASIEGQVSDTLLNPTSRLFAVLRQDEVAALVRDHQRGRRDNHKIIHSLIVFEEWLRRTPVRLP